MTGAAPSLRSHPPAVVYPVQRSQDLARVLVLLVAVSAMGPLLLAISPLPVGLHPLTRFPGLPVGPAVLGGLLWLLGCAVVARWWWRQPQGWLAWCADGVIGWSWSGPEGLNAVPVLQVLPVVSLNRRMAVRLVTASGQAPRWLWLEARFHPPRWLALRRALLAQSPAPLAADTGALP